MNIERPLYYLASACTGFALHYFFETSPERLSESRAKLPTGPEVAVDSLALSITSLQQFDAALDTRELESLRTKGEYQQISQFDPFKLRTYVFNLAIIEEGQYMELMTNIALVNPELAARLASDPEGSPEIAAKVLQKLYNSEMLDIYNRFFDELMKSRCIIDANLMAKWSEFIPVENLGLEDATKFYRLFMPLNAGWIEGAESAFQISLLNTLVDPEKGGTTDMQPGMLVAWLKIASRFDDDGVSRSFATIMGDLQALGEKEISQAVHAISAMIPGLPADLKDVAMRASVGVLDPTYLNLDSLIADGKLTEKIKLEVVKELAVNSEWPQKSRERIVRQYYEREAQTLQMLLNLINPK